MRWYPECYRNKEIFVRTFFQNLYQEITEAENFLNKKECDELRGYYKNFYKELCNEKKLNRQVTGYIRGDLGYVLDKLFKDENNHKLKILDAGCGLGTQSLFFGLLGHEVIGIDLRENRYSVSVKRRKFYERELRSPLKIDFRLTSIFNIKDNDSFDIIWISNAISHIDPLDDLLELCQKLLKPDGQIIIVDLNGMNIIKQFKVYKERGIKKYKKIRDPGTGKDVSYAIERILSLHQQCKILKNHGFKIAYHECFIGYHARANKWLYEKIIKPINQSYLISSIFGGRYVVVGQKQV